MFIACRSLCSVLISETPIVQVSGLPAQLQTIHDAVTGTKDGLYNASLHTISLRVYQSYRPCVIDVNGESHKVTLSDIADSMFPEGRKLREQLQLELEATKMKVTNSNNVEFEKKVEALTSLVQGIKEDLDQRSQSLGMPLLEASSVPSLLSSSKMHMHSQLHVAADHDNINDSSSVPPISSSRALVNLASPAVLTSPAVSGMVMPLMRQPVPQYHNYSSPSGYSYPYPQYAPLPPPPSSTILFTTLSAEQSPFTYDTDCICLCSNSIISTSYHLSSSSQLDRCRQCRAPIRHVPNPNGPSGSRITICTRSNFATHLCPLSS